MVAPGSYQDSWPRRGGGNVGALIAALLPHAVTLRQLHVDVELQGTKTRGHEPLDSVGFLCILQWLA